MKDISKGIKKASASAAITALRKCADDKQDISLEKKLGRKAMSGPALVRAPSVPAPLSEELGGSLRSLKVNVFGSLPLLHLRSFEAYLTACFPSHQTKGAVLVDQMDAKCFALDPQLAVKRALG